MQNGDYGMTLSIRDFQVLKNPYQYEVVAVSDGQFSFVAGFFSRGYAEERFRVGMGSDWNNLAVAGQRLANYTPAQGVERANHWGTTGQHSEALPVGAA
jgi:hypothetical protein